MKWIITTPAWGDRAIDHFRNHSYPAMQKALEQLPADDEVRFVVHSDRPQDLSFITQPCQFLPLPDAGSKNTHAILGACHREALRMTQTDEAIAFINADMVCSIEAFAASRKRLQQGKKMIMVMGTRTFEDAGYSPPIGVCSRALVEWAWGHRHPWITGCIWGTGRSKIPAVLYFKLADGIVLHAFHLHPFVAFKDRDGLSFDLVTIDRDLVEKLLVQQIHVVTDPDELSFAEMSPGVIPTFPPEPEGATLNAERVADFARSTTTHMHRWIFAHRIIITGTCNDMSDVPVCSEILSKVETFVPLPPMGTMSHLSKERRELLERMHAAQMHPFKDGQTFYVVLPAWGKRCVDLTVNYTIPSLRAALQQGNYRVQVNAYTDEPERMRHALGGLPNIVRLIGPQTHNPHELLNAIHKQTLLETPAASLSVLLDGDMVVSKELFTYAFSKFQEGSPYRILAAPCPRACMDKQPPPIGVTARDLTTWAWDNRHFITDNCVWGRTKTSFPNTLFFEKDGNVVMHTFHLHPFVILKDRHCNWIGTIDDDLLSNYEEREILYVENAEVGFVEISPDEYRHGIGEELLTTDSVADWGKHLIPTHRRSFRHQLRLVGFDDFPESRAIADEILHKIRPSIHVPPLTPSPPL
jgi:hypothetical protein